MNKPPIDLMRALEEFSGVGDPGALEAMFDGRPGAGPRPAQRSSASAAAPGLTTLLEAYRHRGFLRARLDPLGLAPRPEIPELDPAAHGLARRDAAELAERLERAYCGSIGWEIGHIHDGARRRWLEAEAEQADPVTPDATERRRILALLARVDAFESGLNLRIPAGKHFGIGGAETFLVALETLIAESARLGVEEVVVGGMHRGRFAMLATIMEKPLTALIAEIQGKPAIPEGMKASSDVSYHLGYSGDRQIAGSTVHFSVSPHPSHLQLAPIITQGRARAKQTLLGPDGARRVLPLLLHTDASFSGQGLVAEMLQLSGLAPFRLGGTVHVLINNQLGFTTTPEEGRTARGASDIARLIEAPVLHVNGDDPEAVWRVALIAANWRARFQSDIIIDLVCYRRPGHNEIDEPRFTQPRMYEAIDARPPVRALYADELAARGLDTDAADSATDAMRASLGSAFAAAKSWKINQADWFEGRWTGLVQGDEAAMLAPVVTGVPAARLTDIGRAITSLPDGTTLDPKVARFLDERRRSIEAGEGINWATGEALALASLLSDGTSVRLGGQDSVRGAFTQRHLEVHDQASGERHLTLAPAARAFAKAEIHNTPLIEHAVLTYEYGISLADPARLVIWEAQFGEFLNYAQPVFDQCIACGEDRWLRSSGLVILLPHGLDGGGPDHSTGRPERLLAACAGANLQVVNASTPANFFHALRRQMARPFRKPLVVLTPKALLRHKACVSTLADFAEGTGFRHVIDDTGVAGASRVLLCTGKIFYDLAAERAARGLGQKVAIVRIEQLHPLPADEIRTAMTRHSGAETIWCEEEPENMGYFTHLDRPLEAITGRRVRRAGRPAVATPAVGVKYWHEAEIKAVLDTAFADLTSA
ncbi:MAG TPA: 2-oxoglutarate dehydrogenase E1 component [Hyphomicrobiaceae bacterium]|nr:2-oxoglutarate dehydrogenase E1 component [Hyphomicrobiaceae bacterium]